MGGIINDFFKTLKPKEKIIVISSMAALGVVLIGVVLLIAFCGKDTSQPGGIKPHEHTYDEYYLDFNGGFFNVKGDCSFEGCDEAKTLATGVAVSQLPIKEATCTESGQILCVYSYNGTTLQYPVKVEKKPHSFDYDVNGNQLSGKCTADGCGETNSVTAVSVVKKSESPATCKEPSKTVYTATLADGSELEVVEYGTDKLSKHTLNGTLIDSSVVYNYANVAGVTSNVKCGETGEGKFVCAVCEAQASITVKMPTHKFKLDYANATYPTGTAVGNIGFSCQNATCTEFVNENIQLPKIKVGLGGNSTIVSEATATSPAYVRYEFDALGIPVVFERIPYVAACTHEYANYKAVPNGTSGYYTVTATCIKPGCDDKNLRVTNATKVSETPATCQQVSTATYRVNGQNIVINGTEKGAHSFVINYATIVNPTATSKGTVEFRCKHAGCMFASNSSTAIDEIEIGVNATIISEATATEPAYVRYEFESFFGTLVLERIPYEP
ncbi:MAG: hypothetical protein E7676_01105 [Ruminococcaceae bacterium]|nr:hypothetical protein [Oscillospiraceae bacterium]